MRSLPFADIAAVDGRGFDVPGTNGQPGGLHARAGDADGLPGLLTVTVEEQTGAEILYRITGTVSWTGAAGDQDFRLEILISNKESS